MAAEGFTLLLDLGLILLAATGFNFAAKLLKQPPLLGYLFAGIFIGPLILGSLGIEISGFHIGVTTTEQIFILSELGVAFLLFSVGIETDIRKFAEFGKLSIVASIIQVVLTALLVLLFNQFLKILSFEQALYLGLIIAFSSTTIVVKLLSDSREINTLHGRIMIGFLIMQDILVILALPLLKNLSGFSFEIVSVLLMQGLALLIATYILSRYIYPAIFRFAVQSEELLFLSAMSSVFVFIFIAYFLNMPIAVGAFIGGVALSTLPYNLEVLQRIRGVRDFLATVFFVTLGIQITPTFISFPLSIILLVLLLVFVLKPAVYFLITMLSGYGGRVSMTVALGLAQVSEFSFVIAITGKHILEQTPGLYSFIILVIAVSMALTPYFLDLAPKLYEWSNRIFGKALRPIKNSNLFHRNLAKLDSVPYKLMDHVVVFGGGTVGSSVIESLKLYYHVVVVDADNEVIAYHIQKDEDAIYGSAENREIWHKAGVESAKLVVLAIPGAKDAVPLIKYLKGQKTKVPVFARAHHFADALTLYDAGADFVIMPHVVGSNLFVRKIFEFLQHGNTEFISDYVHEFKEYLRAKVEEERVFKKF